MRYSSLGQNKTRPPLGLATRVWDFIEEPKSVTLVQALMVYWCSAAFPLHIERL